MKLVFYAINGIGLGHLSRCEAIARQAKLLCDLVGEKVDIQFLTTSDADWIVTDFPVYKFPSKSVFQSEKGAAKRYASGAKIMISNMLAWMRPDALIVDTQAQGAFSEFHFLKDYAKSTVLIERHKLLEQARSAVHQAHLKLYDRIIVPDDEAEQGRYHFPEDVEPLFVGKATCFDGDQALNADWVRSHFGLNGGEKLMFVAAGGGGDQTAAQVTRDLIDRLLEIPHVKVLAAYGPLCQDDAFYSNPRVISVRESRIWRYFSGIDLAISAAGYNTYEELLNAGVPSLFFAQERGLDDQDGRIRIGEAAGWHGRLDHASVVAQCQTILDKGRKSSFPNLANRPVSAGATRAASEIVQTAFSGSTSEAIELKVQLEAAEVALSKGRHLGFKEWLRYSKQYAAYPTIRDALFEIRDAGFKSRLPVWFDREMDFGEGLADAKLKSQDLRGFELMEQRIARRGRDRQKSRLLVEKLSEFVIAGGELSEMVDATSDPDVDLATLIENTHEKVVEK